MKDRHVEAVRKMMKDRMETGILKYGVTLEREDLSFYDWLQHLQEELLDASVYIQRVKSDILESDGTDY